MLILNRYIKNSLRFDASLKIYNQYVKDYFG